MPGHHHTVDLVQARSYPAFLDGRQACADIDPEVFHPESWARAATEPAKKICRRCPLVAPCLIWALRTSQGFGIFGATTPGERRKLARRLNERILRTSMNRGPR